MGMLMSPHEEIERIRFVQFPTRPTKKVEKIVRVDGLIFAKMGERTVACSRDISKFAYPATTRSFPWMEAVLKGLQRLGMISGKVMDDHMRRCRENSAATEREYQADQFRDAAKALGITLTAQQAKAAAKAANGTCRAA